METVMDLLRAHHLEVNVLPSPDFVHQAYSRTADKSSLQKHAILGLKYALAWESISSAYGYYPPGFPVSLIKEKAAYDSAWQTSAVQKLLTKHDNFARDFITSTRGKFNAGIANADPRTVDDCAFHTNDDDADGSQTALSPRTRDRCKELCTGNHISAHESTLIASAMIAKKKKKKKKFLATPINVTLMKIRLF
jgi:hypothetical protein